MFIGGTSLLTETYSAAESAKTQAFNDFTVFTVAAASSFGAGAVLHEWGWRFVNYSVTPLIVIVVMAHIWLKFANRQRTLSTGH